MKSLKNNLIPQTGKLDIAKMRSQIKKSEPSLISVKKNLPNLQLCMMFDITGSMYDKFNLIREKFQEITTDVKSENPNSEYSIMAFRNHGDEEKYEQIYYSTPLTSDVNEIYSLISKIKRGGGGTDALTCMEECLKEANQLNWINNSPKAVIIVGDMPPHGVIDNLSVCPNKIDYTNEITQFVKKGISVYSVYCGDFYDEQVRTFYQKIAQQTNGKFLEIKEIDLLSGLIIGICMKQTNTLQKYIGHLRSTKRLSLKMEKALLMLE